MFYVREFEFYEDEGYMLAVPFDLGPGTFGDDMEDAIESAADYMKTVIDNDLIDGKPVPDPTFGNTPQHGGKVIAIAVDCDLAYIDAVTAAEAARMLGLSTVRVAQMCKSGVLASWRDGSRRMVSRASVEARLAEQPKAGRPRKAIATA